MIRNLLFAGALVACWAPMTGCSVFMAATGNPAPDLSILRVGADRGAVELQLGQPVQVATNPSTGDTTAVYEYWTGDDPSAGRAVFHGVMDVLTLGIWEAVGTPTEAIASGEKHTVTVFYGTSYRVVSVNNPVFVRREDEPVQAGESAAPSEVTSVDYADGPGE